MATKKEPIEPKKKSYDTTSTLRSQRLHEDIKRAGGAVVNVRFRTAQDVAEMDELIAAGEGEDRTDLLRKLVKKRHAQKFKKAVK